MAYSTINKSSVQFNTKLYTGNGADATAYTGVGFQPDFTWIKRRDGTNWHVLTDAVRGATIQIYSNSDGGNQTVANGLQSFNADGFTLGTNTDSNANSGSYVSWNWKANGQGSSNTDGTINTTYTSANTTAGFSIIKYTGNGTTNATIGHGLGVTPSMILFKKIDSSNNWIVYEKSMGTGHYLTLNNNNGKDSASGAWCTPSSTLIQLNQVFGATNTNSATYVAYAFADKTGYSKSGSYVGNNSNDGTFVYTGFKPKFILIKMQTLSGNQWYIYDDKRDGANNNAGTTGGNRSLRPNSTSAEEQASGYPIDILSNGFKPRTTNSEINADARIYMYYAIGQTLVGSNNIPATAR